MPAGRLAHLIHLDAGMQLGKHQLGRARIRPEHAEVGDHQRGARATQPELLPVALAKFRLWEPLTHAPLASGVEPVPGWLDSLLYACLSLESAWLGAGRNLPLGQSLILIGEKMA